MKILVTGGRAYNVRYGVFDVLDGLHEAFGLTHVIHGNANGADKLAGEWAQLRGVQEVACPANWDKHGKAAGYRRNLAMVALAPDRVIAFPGGAGTAMMIRIAKDRRIDVEEYGA